MNSLMAKRYMQSCGHVEEQTSWGHSAGYGAAPRSKKYVSKTTHGFFITMNGMIPDFKHIIHIVDFPLNGHPPSVYYN